MEVVYAKENKKFLIESGKMVPSIANPHTAYIIENVIHSGKNWQKLEPGQSIESAHASYHQAGNDEEGRPLYITRAQFGSGIHPGYMKHTDKKARISFADKYVSISFGHEILTNLDGMEWIAASNGEIPTASHVTPIPAGVDDESEEVLYIARAKVSKGAVLFGILGKAKEALVPGKVSKHYGGAKIPFDKKEILCKEYEVLCIVK